MISMDITAEMAKKRNFTGPKKYFVLCLLGNDNYFTGPTPFLPVTA